MLNCKKCQSPMPEGAMFCPWCGTQQIKEQKKQNTKSRGNGTGTVFKRPNGTWIAMKTLGWEIDSQGKKHRTTVSKSGFKTKREAVNYLPMLTEESSRAAKRLTTTFQDVYDLWEPTHQKTGGTMGCYTAAFKKFSAVWNVPLADITVDDLQDCMDDVEGKRTQQNMKTLCGMLYKYAIPRNLAALNMAQYLIVGGVSGIGKAGLPVAYLDALRENVGKVPYCDYVLAQCYLGFRPSELLALDAAHYNRREKAFVGGAKTDAGKDRTVTISPKIQPIIDRLTAGKIAGPIFCDTDGGKMTIEKYRREFYKVLDACGLENPIITVKGQELHTYTPHSCRHTFATLMKAVTADNKDKLALIGHTTEAMLRHYQDVEYTDLRRITDAI